MDHDAGVRKSPLAASTHQAAVDLLEVWPNYSLGSMERVRFIVADRWAAQTNFADSFCHGHPYTY